MVSSIIISMNLIPLDLLRFVWCITERCIFCVCSMMSRLYKYLLCFWLSSKFASRILSFRNAYSSDLEFFLYIQCLGKSFDVFVYSFHIGMFIGDDR